MHVDTIKIKVAPTAGNEEGIVSINTSDFDPEQHERYEPDQGAAANKAEKTETDSERKKREKKEEMERQRAAANKTEK